MERKSPKPLKSLRVRKESLRTLTSDQLVRVQAGNVPDPWDPTFTSLCVTIA